MKVQNIQILVIRVQENMYQIPKMHENVLLSCTFRFINELPQDFPHNL